jgi:hypothetical protein
MSRVVFDLKSWNIAAGGAEEAALRKALAAVVDGEVASADDLRAERKAEAARLRDRMPRLSETEREAAIMEFAQRHGYLGRGSTSNLRAFARLLAADEQADRLINTLRKLPASGRIETVERFRHESPSRSFERLLRRLEEVDPATARAVLERIPPTDSFGSYAPSVASEAAVLSIVVPAVAGALTSQIVQAALDWVRRVSSRRGGHDVPIVSEVVIYGPDGEELRRVDVRQEAQRRRWRRT